MDAAPPIRELDVRPLLRPGGEPFQAIMQAVAAGHFKVEGEWNDDLTKQVVAPVGI